MRKRKRERVPRKEMGGVAEMSVTLLYIRLKISNVLFCMLTIFTFLRLLKCLFTEQRLFLCGKDGRVFEGL